MTSQEAGRDSMSIGMEDESLVCLVAGGLTLAVREPKKVRKLTSHLEGPGFWPGAMVVERVLPIGWGW